MVVATAVLVAIVLTGCDSGLGLHQVLIPKRSDGSVLIIGDSLTVGARGAGLGASLDGAPVHIDAVVGRSARAARGILERSDLRGVGTIMIALGTNDYLDGPDFGSIIDGVMPATKGRAVIWVNVDTGTRKLAPAVAVNAAIDAAATRHSTLRVADWDSYINSRTNVAAMRAPDGVHYRGSGPAERARWSRRQLSGASQTIVTAGAGHLNIAGATTCDRVQIAVVRSDGRVVERALPELGRSFASVRPGEVIEIHLSTPDSARACRVWYQVQMLGL